MAQVLFDFDHTIIDADSDHHVVGTLAPHVMRTHMETGPRRQSWPTVMSTCFEEMHREGITRSDFERVLATVDVHPALTLALRSIADQGAKLGIISAANTFFIDVILRRHDLQHLFTVDTYPAVLEGDTLRVGDYPHTEPCATCFAGDLCKGAIVRRLRSRRVVYVGDGSNDLCACFQLQSDDVALVRSEFSLAKLLADNSNRARVAAHVFYWANYDELAALLLKHSQ
eukprot:m.60271 g.60271  ORF g.60271 m.60271 type:complete len:228 (-) comp7016_c0_seq3:103-786(-)